MSLALSHACAADAPRIAEIHMAAFGQNPLLLAQFPTPAVRKGLQEAVEAKTRAEIGEGKVDVLVVRDEGSGREEHRYDEHSPRDDNGPVIGFAKWIHPVTTTAEGGALKETLWVWPEGTDLRVLDAWGRKGEEVERRVLGGRACYRLSFMGTDPLYRKRGAATMMIRWGLEKCRREGLPAYLESTLEAVPVYEKFGFTAAADISLRVVEKRDGTADVYEEVACIFESTESESHRVSSL